MKKKKQRKKKERKMLKGKRENENDKKVEIGSASCAPPRVKNATFLNIIIAK